mgnify:CR=1 FL=1
MEELFQDIPEALANSVEIARRCNLVLELGKPYLPDYPVPEGMTMDEFFRKLSHEGLDQRMDQLFDRAAPDFPDRVRHYRERLDFELDIIEGMGFPGYFLIVADFIEWAKDNAIPVGPGRGSGAGCLGGDHVHVARTGIGDRRAGTHRNYSQICGLRYESSH